MEVITFTEVLTYTNFVCTMLIRLLLPVSAVLFTVGGHAQTQPAYFFLGDKEFDGVQIYDVIQDDELNYWIATDNGVYKYDNYVFTKQVFEGAQSLSVFGFVKNNTGTIYCYNLNNQILQINHGICSVLYNLKPEERSSDIYLSISQENDLLVFTRTILLFNPQGVQVSLQKPRSRYYAFPFVTANGRTISHINESDTLLVYQNRSISYTRMKGENLNIKGVLKFFELQGKTFAVSSTSKVIYWFNEDTFELTPTRPTDLEKSAELYRIYGTADNAWAAGVISGVRMLSNAGELSLSETFYPQYLISDVYEDEEGNILLSTFNHGILVVPDLFVPDVLNIPEGNTVASIQSDEQYGMLMGTSTGKLLSYRNGIYTTLSDSGARPLQSIFSWPELPFVIFDDGKVKAMNKLTGEIATLTFGSLKDAVYVGDSVLYLAMNIGVSKVCWKGGNRFETTPEPDLRLRTYAVAYSAQEDLVYVSTSDGVKVLDQTGNAEALLRNGQNVFANDICSSDGIVYLASHNEIHECFNGTIKRSIPVTIQNKPVELTKLEVHNAKFHAITSAGFALFDMNGALITHLNTKQGFSTNRIYDFDYSENVVWICHTKGVQQLSSTALAVSLTKPSLTIRYLFVNDSLLTSLSVPGLFSSQQRKFSFILSSPTLRNKENIRYHYQLSGYDEVWTVAGYRNNEIVYNALAPGDYTFTVKAENAGVFSEPITYSFTISAPFYTRWWFMAIIGVTLLLAITLVYRYRLHLQQRKAKLENELHASRLTAIQSQMNPHFIFNSLNSIQDLVLKGDVDNSYSFITKFSNLVRRTLHYSDKDFVEFSQEIKLLELYLSLEKLRFKDDLEFTLDTEGIEDIMIPPMLIQPFIENSLLHGLLHKEGKKKLSIRFHLDEHLTCIVEDNGIGREKAREIKNRQRAEHESFAGQAIKKRFSILSRIFQSELGYTYEDMYDGDQATGTRVKLTIPVKRTF
jgi:hypothetical protein